MIFMNNDLPIIKEKPTRKENKKNKICIIKFQFYTSIQRGGYTLLTGFSWKIERKLARNVLGKAWISQVSIKTTKRIEQNYKNSIQI